MSSIFGSASTSVLTELKIRDEEEKNVISRLFNLFYDKRHLFEKWLDLQVNILEDGKMECLHSFEHDEHYADIMEEYKKILTELALLFTVNFQI